MASGDLYALKDILGHKNIAMTQRYAHLSPAYKRAMVDRMEQDLGEAWEPTSGDARYRESSKARSETQSRHKNCSGTQRLVRSPFPGAV